MRPSICQQVRLCNVEQRHLSHMYRMQCDQESNQMAMTIPRSAEDFYNHWTAVLGNEKIIAKAIFVGERMAGNVCCFQVDSLDHVGYWIDRRFWNKGVATQALRLLLLEVARRPLHARVAASNVASLRVLERCGFQVTGIEAAPADNRHLECEAISLVLT